MNTIVLTCYDHENKAVYWSGCYSFISLWAFYIHKICLIKLIIDKAITAVEPVISDF